jgi:branched-chain amino acid aminotransferase
MSNSLQTVYINGELQPVDTASVSVFDSGFNFGDGVFEGLRVYEGRVLFLTEHIRRLYESAAAIFLNIPMTQQEMCDAILRWLGSNQITDDFHFRPIVTRGVRMPPRVDPRFASGTPNIVFLGAPIDPAATARGVRVVISRYRSSPPDVVDSKIKSLSFLGHVLSKLDAIQHGADDAIVLDQRGVVAEGSTSNMFVVRHGQLLTPWPTASLEGITRKRVIDIGSELGFPVNERDLTTTDLHAADEIFLSGTGAEITSVIEFEGQPVGQGLNAPITERIRERYLQTIADFGTPIPGVS